MLKYIIEGKEIEGVGVNGNCIPVNKLPREKCVEIAKKGAKASHKKRAENKKEKKIMETLPETLLRVLNADITPKNLKKKLIDVGLNPEKETYFTVMIVVAMLKDCKNGNFNDVLKIIELIEKINKKDETDGNNNEQLRQLIESVKNV